MFYVSHFSLVVVHIRGHLAAVHAIIRKKGGVQSILVDRPSPFSRVQ
ncbi:hypothetical protein ACWODC_08015 [Enterococcus raffinosus]|nr:hypothetical protein RV13_GL001466 [Enterococcus raffinosus]